MSRLVLSHGPYRELIFMDVYWPAFRKIDLLRGNQDIPEAETKDGKIAAPESG